MLSLVFAREKLIQKQQKAVLYSVTDPSQILKYDWESTKVLQLGFVLFILFISFLFVGFVLFCLFACLFFRIQTFI